VRDYGKVVPRFWTAGTGRSLRGDPNTQVLALYLMTCPTATMIGIFHLSLPTIAYDTGIPADAVIGGLKKLAEAGFVSIDEMEDLVFVHQMARVQIDDILKPGDKRKQGVIKDLRKHGNHPFVDKFLEMYEAPFGLSELLDKPLRSPSTKASPFEAPSKPHRSQDQDQDQDQDPPIIPPRGDGVGSVGACESESDIGAERKSAEAKKAECKSDQFIAAWKLYPRKEGKDAAWRAWKKAAKRIGGQAALLEKVSAALHWQKTGKKWREQNGDFIPHFATYLNSGRYDDEREKSGIDMLVFE
jgi:hypothetical protein